MTTTEFAPFSPTNFPLPTMLSQSSRKATGHLFTECPAVDLVEKKGTKVQACPVCLDLFRQIGARQAAEQRAFDEVWAASPGQPVFITEVPAPKPAEAPAERMATKGQFDLLKAMFSERRVSEVAQALRTALLAEHKAGRLTFKLASQGIDALKEIPRDGKASPAPTAPQADVADGYYAITSTGSNDLAFYRVTSSEKWGKSVQLIVGGHADQFVRRAAVAGILARIAADPEAGPRYGQEIGQCCACNRTLTDEESRRLGIGPKCRAGGRD